MGPAFFFFFGLINNEEKIKETNEEFCISYAVGLRFPRGWKMSQAMTQIAVTPALGERRATFCLTLKVGDLRC